MYSRNRELDTLIRRLIKARRIGDQIAVITLTQRISCLV